MEMSDYYELCGNTKCIDGKVGPACSPGQGICQNCGGSGYVATSKGNDLLEFLTIFRKATHRGSE